MIHTIAIVSSFSANCFNSCSLSLEACSSNPNKNLTFFFSTPGSRLSLLAFNFSTSTAGVAVHDSNETVRRQTQPNEQCPDSRTYVPALGSRSGCGLSGRRSWDWGADGHVLFGIRWYQFKWVPIVSVLCTEDTSVWSGHALTQYQKPLMCAGRDRCIGNLICIGNSVL